jgi:NAD(P)H-dependent FMN reductase/ketosteroid isomerase-like protein
MSATIGHRRERGNSHRNNRQQRPFAHTRFSKEARMSGKTLISVVVGSLRKESFSRKVARALIAQAPASLECRIVEIADLPMYNEDLDDRPPEQWVRFRDAIRSSRAVLFVTPEYNRSIPGCLKNAVDVASRPYGKSVLDGRPAGVVSVTPHKLGAFGANHAIRQTFVFLNMPVMQQPEAYVSNVGELFVDKGQLKSPETREFLAQFMTAFSRWIAQISDGSQAESFDRFMQKRIEAARAYVNGDAQPLDQIVAESGTASFFPPNGGSERGAKEVSARYDRDAQSFGEGGETDLEVLHSASAGDVAFWTGFQNARVNLRGAPETVTMKLRITEVFRRIGGEWKMVHRHADPMVEAVKHESGERAPPRQRSSGEARQTL